MSQTQDLTVVVLSFNEEARIRRCVGSLNLPCKLVIMDSFSTDQTLSEARKAWRDLKKNPEDLVLVEARWEGFTKTRNRSLEWVHSPYVLWLDSDEWLSEELCEELKDLSKLPESEKIFRLPRQSFFLGRAIRHGGWYPDRKSRLARSSEVEWLPGPGGADVHEDLFERSGEKSAVKKRFCLKGHLFHESFRDRAEQEETNRRYSALLAEGLARKYRAQNRKAPSTAWIYTKVLIKFLENYFMKLGLLDGYPGFVIARGSATSLKMRYEKLASLLK